MSMHALITKRLYCRFVDVCVLLCLL